MGLIDSVKSNGNVELEKLSAAQIIALVAWWDTPFAKKENKSFFDMLSRCYKSTPWHVNAPILYLSKDNTVTYVKHSFYDMYEHEEDSVIEALKSNLLK